MPTSSRPTGRWPRRPPELLARIGAARERVDHADLPVGELDTPEAIARARDWLTHDALPSYKGAGGDAATLNAALGARDFGVSEVTCLELMLEHWNERGAPSWEPEKLQVKVMTPDELAALIERLEREKMARAILIGGAGSDDRALNGGDDSGLKAPEPTADEMPQDFLA